VNDLHRRPEFAPSSKGAVPSRGGQLEKRHPVTVSAAHQQSVSTSTRDANRLLGEDKVFQDQFDGMIFL